MKKIKGKKILWKDRKCKLWKKINGNQILWKDIKCKLWEKDKWK